MNTRISAHESTTQPAAIIEAIGGKRDGVIRHHYRRRDGSVRDTVMYSILATEWPDVKKHLTTRVARLAR